MKTYQVSRYKKTGKFYDTVEPIIAPDLALYTEVPKILRERYPDEFNDPNGFMFFVMDTEYELGHIFNTK